jgi:hypothetical protein
MVDVMNDTCTEIVSSHRTSEGLVVYTRVDGVLEVRLEPYAGPARVIAEADTNRGRRTRR